VYLPSVLQRFHSEASHLNVRVLAYDAARTGDICDGCAKVDHDTVLLFAVDAFVGQWGNKWARGLNNCDVRSVHTYVDELISITGSALESTSLRLLG
jgi:hypothetical protein